MAQIEQRPTVSVSATFLFDEAELRALEAMTDYGLANFVQLLTQMAGDSRGEQHKKAMTTLYQTIHDKVPSILFRADRARKEFEA